MFLEGGSESLVEFVEDPVEVKASSVDETVDRLSILERSVVALGRRLDAAHELMARVVETNVLLRRGAVPAHEPDEIARAAAAAGIPERKGGANGGGGAGNGASASGGGVVSLVRGEMGLVIKGKTYDIKDELKARFGARWDASFKAWTVDAALEAEVADFLTKQGFEVK